MSPSKSARSIQQIRRVLPFAQQEEEEEEEQEEQEEEEEIREDNHVYQIFKLQGKYWSSQRKVAHAERKHIRISLMYSIVILKLDLYDINNLQIN